MYYLINEQTFFFHVLNKTNTSRLITISRTATISWIMEKKNPSIANKNQIISFLNSFAKLIFTLFCIFFCCCCFKQTQTKHQVECMLLCSVWNDECGHRRLNNVCDSYDDGSRNVFVSSLASRVLVVPCILLFCHFLKACCVVECTKCNVTSLQVPQIMVLCHCNFIRFLLLTVFVSLFDVHVFQSTMRVLTMIHKAYKENRKHTHRLQNQR